MTSNRVLAAFALVLLAVGLWLAARDGRLPFAGSEELPAGAIDAHAKTGVLYAGREEPRRPLAIAAPLMGWSRLYHYLDARIGVRFPALTTRVTWARVEPGARIADGSIVRAESWPRAPAWGAIALVVAGLAMAATASVRSWRAKGIVREHFPGVAISAALLAVCWAVAEGYLRTRMPFVERIWPGQVHPVGGLILQPGKVLRHTNNIEFWVEERSNSLGFLDREPVLPKPAGTFRILVLGDSFIEAAQVPTAQKYHVLLEARLRELFPGREIDVVAMSYSGTGQSAQLSFYELYGHRLEPDLVINVAARNDLANNSPWLESVRHGWHPQHAPRLFYDVDSGSSGFRRIPVDVTYQEHFLYRSSGNPKRDAATRLTILRREAAGAAALSGWGYPDDLDMDEMFCADRLPPAFEQAEAITARVFGVLAEAARKDHARMLLVIAENATTLCDVKEPKRAIRREAAANRLKRAAAAAGIEALDLYPAFAAHGDIQRAIFPIDQHWNATGHAWAARATAEFLRSHPQLLEGTGT